MQAVMKSVSPKQCEQIASGKIDDKLIGMSAWGVQENVKKCAYILMDDGSVERNEYLTCDIIGECTIIGFTSKGIVVWVDDDAYYTYFNDGNWFLTKEKAKKRLEEMIKGE